MALSSGTVDDAERSLGGRAVPLRVAIVNWRDPWQRAAGGAELYAWRMAEQLRNRGAAVTFVTGREPGQARRETRDGIRIVRMGGVYSRYPLVLGWLLRHRNAFDVAIDCMNGIPFLSPLALAPKTKIILLVHHVHEQQFSVYFGRFLAAVGRTVEGPIARRIYRGRPTVAVSASTAFAMRGRLRWAGPLYIVPNGAPAPVPHPSGTAAGSPSLVCVGRLVAHKRVEELIDATAALRADHPGVHLHIVGRGEEHDALAARIAELDLAGHVTLHGYLPEHVKDALLAGADLHLSASRHEGWGLSVIEAAAHGLPTVAYDVDGLRDAIRDGETGWLAAPEEDLADAVRRALKDLKARGPEFHAACRAWAGRFTWEASGDRMHRLIMDDLDAF
ncbi:glycosyltransferase family 4 protein [Actinocorallia sp. A-T 12471]|uniref:glycosyltransferase family 4 protein n=1 Tax=Actinocorallia sp. A-T 12471 TaxID=3089813 RepID=UPI0029CEE21B|nr:glycosyltransferase family 4 protein [Actinocorallia sp. A-T 12471]MDX6743818.1 glycosyltransferase family 4 protein [Actinocorallia sp. A-T 12471]